MFVIEKDKEATYSLPAKEIGLSNVSKLGSELAVKILKSIAEKPKYPKEIAKELKVHEQKVYYHIKNLEKAGLIKVAKTEDMQGAVAKYYVAVEPAFVLRLKKLEPTQKISHLKKQHRDFLEPFIENGRLNALIIVGSPDPHGPDKARSRDGYYGIDLALFFGTFLNYVPGFNVKLDTEVHEADLKNNLIIMGGPVTNKITAQVNKDLPVKFDEHTKNIFSTISNQSYPADEVGIIVKAPNPFNKNRSILVVAGKRYMGTRAAIIAFLKNFKEITAGNIYNRKVIAKVVEGIDLNSDGIVDDVEFRE